MPKDSGEKVYRMKLEEYHRYLDDKRRELEACYKDVEEVQFQFNDIFKQELAGWQERFAYCFPRVGAGRREMPAAFAQAIDASEAEERAKLEKEIADLEQRIRDGRAKMDKVMADAQEASNTLRAKNPELNEREEKTKALIVKYQDEYAQAYAEVEKLDYFPFGWLVNGDKIRRLKKAMAKAKEQQTAASKGLRTIRQKWQDALDKAGETQAALRDEWQKESVAVSQAETRREHLQTNLADLAEQSGLQHVLEGLKEPPEVPGELGDALKELVRRNHVRWDYEGGLKSVAETLGLLKGVGEGLARFQKSLATVVQEQRRYNLKDVKAELPEFVVRFNETYKELQTKVKDEKYMGTHPLEFSRTVDAYIKERFTDASIQALFEVMGEALNKATKEWK